VLQGGIYESKYIRIQMEAAYRLHRQHMSRRQIWIVQAACMLHSGTSKGGNGGKIVRSLHHGGGKKIPRQEFIVMAAFIQERQALRWEANGGNIVMSCRRPIYPQAAYLKAAYM
jgi:hypothetical protein